MSMKERLDDTIYETKMIVFGRQDWQCIHVDEYGHRCPRQATQLAHVLPQDKLHLGKYGSSVIHHHENLRGTCPQHNATVQINYRSRPREATAHAAEVARIIRKEKEQAV